MAKQTQTIVTVIDDFDGNTIDDGLAETIDFSFDGTSYRIDLRPTNADKFRKDMEKWIAAAPKVQGKRGRPKGSGSSRPNTGSGRSKEELQAIRDWAVKNGHDVSPRGRIASPILEAYDAAHESASSSST
ncbi:Lsr2 family protein [Mycolicibacterium moriokaense]|nr:Lsr2 family protein [Mycolicibacterium moriokaense]